MNLEISDCHPFFRIEWTSEILSDGASTRLGPVSQSVNRLKSEFFLVEILRVYFLKMVTEKSPVKWSYPLFLESAKLEFHCNMVPWEYGYKIFHH